MGCGSTSEPWSYKPPQPEPPRRCRPRGAQTHSYARGSRTRHLAGDAARWPRRSPGSAAARRAWASRRAGRRARRRAGRALDLAGAVAAPGARRASATAFWLALETPIGVRAGLVGACDPQHGVGRLEPARLFEADGERGRGEKGGGWRFSFSRAGVGRRAGAPCLFVDVIGDDAALHAHVARARPRGSRRASRTGRTRRRAARP